VYFGQNKFMGQGFPTWQGNSAFRDGWGLDIDLDGTISAAKTLGTVAEEVDAANPDGWVGFRIGYPNGVAPDGGGNRIVFVGKTDGISHVRKNTGGWSRATKIGGVGVKAVSHNFFSRLTFIGASDGNVYRTDDGVTYNFAGMSAGKGATAPATNAYILGNLKGFLYVGYSDGSIWRMGADLVWETTPFVDAAKTDHFDMTPVCGATGTNVLYFVTEGPSPRVFFTDGKEVFQANVIASDFNPHSAVFFGKLFIFGEQGFDVSSRGAIWTISATGVAEELTFGDGSVNQGIWTAQIEGEQILWTATGNASIPSGQTGIGVWDPRLDRSTDAALGYYVSNTTPYAAGKNAHGLAALEGNRYMGVTGVGIFKTGVQGNFRVRLGQYDGDSKNIMKHWYHAELVNSAIVNGQSLSVKTTMDGLPGTVETLWGTVSTIGETRPRITGPVQYRNPQIGLIVEGVAAGQPLTMFDASLAYLVVPLKSQVLHEWVIRIAVEGWDDPILPDPTQARQGMRDGSRNTRTSPTIIADLDNLWNTEVVFEDLDGHTYNVLVKSPTDRPEAGKMSRFQAENDRKVNCTTGLLVNLSLDYTLHLIEMNFIA
jgi:hypothetical protein